MLVDLFDLTFVAHDLRDKQAWTMQVEPVIEHLLVERVDGLGVLLRNVAVAHMLPDDAGILALRQGVVVAVASA